MTDWQAFSDDDFEYHRATVQGYIVHVRPDPPARSKATRKRATAGWFVHILMPDDERQKAFLAGPGFDHGVNLLEAKRIAEEVTLRQRLKLEGQAKRRELEARGQAKSKRKKP